MSFKNASFISQFLPVSFSPAMTITSRCVGNQRRNSGLFFAPLYYLASTILFLLSTVNLHGQNREMWVDSVYQTLTADQRLAQLFIIPMSIMTKDQKKAKADMIIKKYAPGGVQFVNGTPEFIINKVNEINQSGRLPIHKVLNISDLATSTFTNFLQLPNTYTLNASKHDSAIVKLAHELDYSLHTLGVDMAWYGHQPINKEESNGEDATLNLLPKKYKALADGFHQVKFGQPYFHGFDENKGAVIDEKGAKRIIAKNGSAKNDLGALISHSFSFEYQSAAISSSLEKNNTASETVVMIASLKDTRNYKAGKTEAQAIKEGAHMVVSHDIEASIDQLKKLIKRNKIIENAIEERVKSVLKSKYSINALPVNKDNITLRLNNSALKAALQQVYRKSVTVIDKKKVLPINMVDTYTFAALSTSSLSVFRNYLNKYALFTHYRWGNNLDGLSGRLAYYQTVVITVDRKLSKDQVDFINGLDNRQVIVASFGDPSYLQGLRADMSKVLGYDHSEQVQAILPQVIFGALQASGRLPIHIDDHLAFERGQDTPSLARLGFATPEEVQMNERILDRIDDIAVEAISEKHTPGCQVLVARHGQVIYQKAFGYYTYDSLLPVTNHTIYDIASITKVAATTQAVMFMEERGLIDLDKKISVYLSDLVGSNKENMIIRDILTHQAGLWPYLPFWRQTLKNPLHYQTYYKSEPVNDYHYQISDGLYASELTRDSVWQWVKASRLRKKEPGTPYDYKYSDMGYYMLQRLIEKYLNQPMEEFLQQNFYDPMGLTTLSYLPLCKMPLSSIAPTEYDNYFRNTLVYGLVHDQGAAMMGGVAGHAGLFSNALDLAKLMQMNLWDGYYGGHRYLRKGTVKKFTEVQYESNRRGMGWDKPVVAELNSPTSPYASKQTFGHSGFTGTAVWVDPEFDLIYVFLSNRIYPDAGNAKLIQNNVRTRIQDIIYQSIFKYDQPRRNH